MADSNETTHDSGETKSEDSSPKVSSPIVEGVFKAARIEPWPDPPVSQAQSQATEPQGQPPAQQSQPNSSSATAGDSSSPSSTEPGTKEE